MNEIDPTELYGTRLLLFIETEPQSNKYRQIKLGPEEFKKVSGSFGLPTNKKINISGHMVDEIDVAMSDEIYDLPDLQEIDQTRQSEV